MGLLFAVAFLVRVVSALGSVVFGTDSCHYLLMADWMREGRFGEALALAYHPMFSLLIAALRIVPLSTEQAGTALTVVLGSAATLPLYRTALAVFGRPVAVLTALLYAFNPFIIEVQSDPMTEGTYMFFLFSSLWLTLRMIEEPSLEGGIVLGMTAAAAFLTRPEGIEAIVYALFWPGLVLILRPGDRRRRLGSLALTLAVTLLLLAPYLLWVKAERGHWALSVRPSAIAAEKAAGLNPSDYGLSGSGSMDRTGLYRSYGVALLRLTLYGALVPFYVVGMSGFRNLPAMKTLLYFSYPLGQLGGVLYVLRASTSISDRYLMAGIALMGALAALGMVRLLGAAARRWPEARWRPILTGAALLALVFLPAVKAFKVRRTELRGYADASRWILAQNPHPKVSGIEQVSYYCGSPSRYVPRERNMLSAFLDRERLDYLVYSEKDVLKDPQYVALLKSWDRLDPPVELTGPPGAWKVYVLRVK
jgi:hypothetical protein